MKILIIDDEDMILDLTKRILKKAGLEVLLAKSGREGIDIFMANQTDVPVIVVDMGMPEMNGLETIEHIWSKTQDIQFIISSGNEVISDEIPEDLRDNVKFLKKPYRASQFTDLINEILQSV